ncbi:carbohydrate kinase family protein [Patescibacteria group bacterium]
MAKRKNIILISGSLAFDRIMDFPGRFRDHIIPYKIRNLNVSFLVEKYYENFGGTAGNIAYNLALLGSRPVILSSVGKDFLKYRFWLTKHKVVTKYVNIVENEATSAAHMITDQDDNQISGYFPGAGTYETPIPPQSVLANASFGCVSPGGVKDMKKYPKIFKNKKITYAYDPGQQLTTLTKNELLMGSRGSEIFISNDYELTLFLKRTGITERHLLNNVKVVVTTLGPKGSIIKTGNEKIKISPAKPKNTSDPTGAGDAYRAGFIYGYVNGYSLEQCGKLGAVVSVYTVEKYGTQTHSFSKKELQLRYKSNFKRSISL